MKDSIRLDKLLSSQGYSSRRNVDMFLKENIVTIKNKRIFDPGRRIKINNEKVSINGKVLKEVSLVYYLLNKPKGVITTASDEFGRKNVVSLVKTKERIFPIGRLDKDTHGLIILTNDGELTNLLTHPRYHVSKTYMLKIAGHVDSSYIYKFQNGIKLDDGKTKPAKARIVRTSKESSLIEIVLYEGRKRQIRRMCEAIGVKLLDLSRTKIGHLTSGSLKEGEYKLISKKDIARLRKLAKKGLG